MLSCLCLIHLFPVSSLPFCTFYITLAKNSFEFHLLKKESQETKNKCCFLIQDALSPPSDGENLSDSTNTSDGMSGGGLDDVPSVRRSVSFKERRKTTEPEAVMKRRNSDIDLQVTLQYLSLH